MTQAILLHHKLAKTNPMCDEPYPIGNCETGLQA